MHEQGILDSLSFLADLAALQRSFTSAFHQLFGVESVAKAAAMPAPTRVVAAGPAEAAGASAGVDALAVCQRDVGPRDRGMAVGAMGGLLVPGLCVGMGGWVGEWVGVGGWVCGCVGVYVCVWTCMHACMHAHTHTHTHTQTRVIGGRGRV